MKINVENLETKNMSNIGLAIIGCNRLSIYLVSKYIYGIKTFRVEQINFHCINQVNSGDISGSGL